MMKQPVPLALALAVVLALSGCAGIPADRDRLPQRDVAKAELPSSIRLAREGWPDAQWWKAYDDPQLDGLMQAALASAPTLDTAAAQIAAAQAAFARSSAELGVETSLNAGGNRQRYSATGLFPAPIGGAWFTEETLRVEGRYHFDWWGRDKAEITAAAGEVNARRASYAGAEQSLAAAIAQHYFSLQSGWARREVLLAELTAQQGLIEDKAKRIARGLAPADEQRSATMQASLLEKDLAQLDADNAIEQQALRALLGAGGNSGAGPDALVADLKPVALRSAPAALPARLGIELLARRPDLQAQRWRVESALGRVDAAQAAFYPDVNLTASLGLNSVSMSQLLRGASRTFFVGPSLSLPLFDSQRLSANLAGARADRNILIAGYNDAVVQAVREVAQDTLTLQGIEAQLAQQQKASADAQSLLHSAQARADHGLADRSSVLAARQAALRQKDAELRLQHAQLLAEVALVHSLGGGYQGDAPPLITK
ncbi:efflux transporter outer membrane subunit [Pseudoduganella sp. UC29_106]|uniref:efflux transporter outer membrane subunit n=1 Tax=Pseudoduganella sp. UC29_106 TaxID=3374553 RepID=UPI0037572704